MKPTKLNRIADIFNELQEINQYMAGLQEMAVDLIESDMTTELTLTGNKPKTEKLYLNDDGDLVSENSKDKTDEFIITFFGRRKPEMTPTPDAEIHHNISQTVSLKILALLLEEKQIIKNQLLEKLERLGVKIQ